MCYAIYFSTTSDRDFSRTSSDHYKISLPAWEPDAEYLELLEHSHRWNLQSRFGGCSCDFWHRLDVLDFGPVEDGSAEVMEDVESTGHFYDLLRLILGEGHKVDLLDFFEGTPPEDIVLMEVNLEDFPRDHFRFLEGKHMLLSP